MAKKSHQRLPLRVTLDPQVCPEVIEMLAPLSRDARRMVAIQLLRDGVFFRRWHGNQPAAPAPNGNGKIEPKDGAGWQPLCDTDPLDEFGIRP